MLRIGICDDDPQMAGEIKKQAEQSLNNRITQMERTPDRHLKMAAKKFAAIFGVRAAIS